MTIEIKQMIVPSHFAKLVTFKTTNRKKKIVIHETDNTSYGANAERHALLQLRGNSREASWHYQVDQNQIIQSFLHSASCFAAGSFKGNIEGIQIEMCVNPDNDFVKTINNTAKLVAHIIKVENLTINDIVQHNYYSGKNCPKNLRTSNPVTWNEFINLVESELKGDEIEMTELGREACKELIKKAVEKGYFNKSHLEKMDTYSDKLLISYSMVYLNKIS